MEREFDLHGRLKVLQRSSTSCSCQAIGAPDLRDEGGNTLANITSLCWQPSMSRLQEDKVKNETSRTLMSTMLPADGEGITFVADLAIGIDRSAVSEVSNIKYRGNHTEHLHKISSSDIWADLHYPATSQLGSPRSVPRLRHAVSRRSAEWKRWSARRSMLVTTENVSDTFRKS